MRSRTDGYSILALAAAAWLTAASAQGADPADEWPAQVPPMPDATTFNARWRGLENIASTLPRELWPAVRCEQTFLQIMARKGESEWLPAMRALADAPGADPVTAAAREVARAWVARVQMRAIDAVLETYYAQNVRFPATLAEVDKNLPRELKTDPWGDPWSYRAHAPAGFSKQTNQRYTLGPKRWPQLGTLREATVERPPFTPPAWKITPVQAGGANALEFRAGPGGAVLGIMQAGGRVDAYTLAYVGDHWALLAGPDQFFAVTF